jgi:hypothetical protein
MDAKWTQEMTSISKLLMLQDINNVTVVHMQCHTYALYQYLSCSEDFLCTAVSVNINIQHSSSLNTA